MKGRKTTTENDASFEPLKEICEVLKAAAIFQQAMGEIGRPCPPNIFDRPIAEAYSALSGRLPESFYKDKTAAERAIRRLPSDLMRSLNSINAGFDFYLSKMNGDTCLKENLLKNLQNKMKDGPLPPKLTAFHKALSQPKASETEPK